MYKVGILGADTLQAGELIRLLIHHPEIEIGSLFAPALLGRNITSVHHGFIGETSLAFTDKIDLSDIDLLFVIQDSEISKKIISQINNFENLFLIVFSKDLLPDKLEEKFETGLSEINRKALVRGAKNAYLLSPSIVPTLIALVPLAHFMLLNSDIKIKVELPSDLREEDLLEQQQILGDILKKNQASFTGKVFLTYSQNYNSERASITHISINSTLPIDEIERVYEQIYDDHNFVFSSLNDVEPHEVEGTQKVVIYLDKPDHETLTLKVVADARLRGGAGDAIHVMNLFFSLYEKTGLHLKPSCYLP